MVKKSVSKKLVGHALFIVSAYRYSFAVLQP